MAVKTFACGEVVPDCPAVFRGPDFEAVLSEVAAHARADHHLPELPPEVAEAVRQAWLRSGSRVGPGPDDRDPGGR